MFSRITFTWLGLTLLALLTANSLMAEAPTKPTGELSHSLKPYELTLDNGKKNCQLQTIKKSEDTNKTIPLLLESPCYWIVSGETKELLSYSYESIAVDSIALLAGTPLKLSTEEKTYQKLPLDSYCSQYLQGVVISKEQVLAVNEKMVAAHCETGLAIDEKIFYAMAHNPERYHEKLPNPVEGKAQSTQAAKALEAPAKVTPEIPKEKSFLDSVTDSIFELFSKEDEDAKKQ